jgi:hypothetical protein
LVAVLISLIATFSKWGRGLSSNARMLVLSVGAGVGIVMFAPLVRSLFIALTPNMAFAVVIVLGLLLGILTLLLDGLTQSFRLSTTLSAIGVAFLAAGSMTAGFDAQHPRPNSAFYMRNELSNQAYVLSGDEELDDRIKTLFPANPVRRKVPELFGEEPRTFWAAASPVSVQAPVVEVLRDESSSGVRNIEIQIRSPRLAPKIMAFVAGDDVLSSSVDGRPFSSSPETNWSMYAYGMPIDGVRVALQLKVNKPFIVRVIDDSYGLPGRAPSSADMLVLPFGPSDTEAVKTIEFK